MSKVSKYGDIVVKSFDVYNACRFEYYLQSLGKQMTTVTGAVGLVTNIAGIFLSQWAADYEEETTAMELSNVNVNSPAATYIRFRDLDSALYRHDPAKIGEFIGTVLFKLISVELPSYGWDAKDPLPYKVSREL